MSVPEDAVRASPCGALPFTAAVLAVMLLIGGALPVMAQDDVDAAGELATPAAEAPVGFDREMAERVGEVIDQVHPIRGLPPATDVSYRIIDDSTFRAELIALLAEEYPDEYLTAEDAAWTRLGLLGPEDDLAALILEVYDSQVLAYYEPRTRTFSLIGPIDEIGPLESTVVAHEYEHALQDARWDLEGNRIKELDRSDAMLAQQALVEGDATAVMNDWALAELGPLDALRMLGRAVLDEDARALTQMPLIIQRQLEFPYLDGLTFVQAIRARDGWDAVDSVWEAQPVSTEQILHPDSYPHEMPVDITLPDVSSLLGPAWTTSYEQTLGEMQVGVWLADGVRGRSFLGLPGALPRAAAGAGWGGDRLASLDGPDGSWALVWQTEWDSPSDQAEFATAAAEVMQDLAGAHWSSDADIAGGLSSPVLVLVADSEGTLAALEEALGL